MSTKYIVNNQPNQTINGNEIQTIKYKVYTALLTQSGTASPSAIVLENTLGVAVTFEYVSTGLYSLQALGALTINKTFVTFNSVNGNSQTVACINKLVDGFLITTRNSLSNTTDNILDLTEIEIRVYLPEPLVLTLGFDNISNVPVANASSVSNWNTFFDLPANGTPFTSVSVFGNNINLFGGSNITLKDSLFDANINLISVVDNANCITTAGDSCIYNCTSLTTLDLPSLETTGDFSLYGLSVTTISLPSLTTAGLGGLAQNILVTSFNLPSLITAGDSCFNNCTSATSFNLPSCANLGTTVVNNDVFGYIEGNTITLTIPSALMSCNDENPDGDIQSLQYSNTVTIIDPATSR